MSVSDGASAGAYRRERRGSHGRRPAFALDEEMAAAVSFAPRKREEREKTRRRAHGTHTLHITVFEVTETSGAQVTDERKLDTIKRVREKRRAFPAPTACQAREEKT